MAKVNNKTKGFGSIPRDVVYDNELSDRARFVYVYMACKPENWEFYQDKVAAELGYGKDTLRKYLDELITRGWLTENEQHNDGKFGCLEYDIEVERKKGNLPIRKKADTEKSRIGKIPNQRNIDNISSKHSLSDNKEIEINKRLSNDNQKNEYSDDFLNFWALYDYPKDKKTAYSRWRHLNKESKELAVKAIPAYFEDCARNNRCKQHPATYLNKRTFEDDFNVQGKIAFYDVLPTDSEQEKKFKNWMRTSYPNIENTALPLSYGDFMSLYTDFGTEEIKNQLEVINANIGKYKYSDINAIIRGNLEDI